MVRESLKQYEKLNLRKFENLKKNWMSCLKNLCQMNISNELKVL